MKTSSRDVDHKKLLLSHLSSFPCFILELFIRDAVRATDVNVMESPHPPPITVILPFLALDCHFCLFWFELQLQTASCSVFVCCVSWVTVCVCCRSWCWSSPPSQRLQPQFPSQDPGASSVLSLQHSCECRERQAVREDPGLAFFYYYFPLF